MHKKNYIPGCFLQFSPAIIFVALYSMLAIYFVKNYSISKDILIELPLFASSIATLYAFFTFQKKMSIDEKIKIFLEGLLDYSLTRFYSTFVAGTIFVHLLAQIGAKITLVNLLILVLPSCWILPSIFILSSLISIVVSSWVVCILFFVPIACAIAQTLQINSFLMTATAVSGILSGYQISISLAQMNYHEKFKEMLSAIIPASIFTILFLSMYQYEPLHAGLYQHLYVSLVWQDYITLLPLFLFLSIAWLGWNLVVNLIINSILSCVVGLLQYKITLLDVITSLFKGFYGQPFMIKFFILTILLSGLMNIINHNRGFHYIIDKIKHKIKNIYLRQCTIILIILIINFAIACDVISIQILIPMMKKMSDKYNISYKRTTILLYLITTTVSSLLPYAPIILLSSYLSHSSPIELISYMFYPIILLAWIMISVFIFKHQNSFKKNFHRSSNR